PQIAHQTNVEFAARDVFLGDDVTIVFVMDKSDPFTKLLIAFNERGLRNAERRFFFQWFYHDWEPEPLRSRDPFATGNDDEVGHANPMITQDFFEMPLCLHRRRPVAPQ